MITKKHYRNWRDIQESVADYMTSLGPWTVDEVLRFLQEEYGLSDYEQAAQLLSDFMLSEREEMDLAELSPEE
ncbi:MAG: hypothetical protein QXS20_04820 [Candidatus Thorarchaeota archaeon]